MRKMIAAGITALFLAGGAFGASASPDADGPAKKGLCTAYYNGSETGREHKRKAGPFQALEEAADEAGNDDGEATAEEVAAFCDGLVGGRAGDPDKGEPGKP